MKETGVAHSKLILDLQHEIAGVRFLDFKEDYDAIDLPSPKPVGPLCYLVSMAMDGNHFKCKASDVTCDYARYALGLSKPDNTIVEGRSYHYCGLYESRAIAKEIVASMKYIDQDIYGIEIGPLKDMEKADVVIIADYAETIMRIMQAYAYKHGTPKNLNFFGCQAMCADMVSKPYSNNDINISLMCKGARAYGRFDKGELSVAFPINFFDDIAEGIVMTLNPVHTLKDKTRILAGLNDPSELGIEIDDRYVYGIGLKEYDGRVRDLRNKG